MELKEISDRERRREMAGLPFKQKLRAVRTLFEIKQKMRHSRERALLQTEERKAMH